LPPTGSGGSVSSSSSESVSLVKALLMGLTVTSAFQRNELTAILVKQALPFERRVEQAAKLKPMWSRDLDAPF
jgi:hypothetical protein